MNTQKLVRGWRGAVLAVGLLAGGLRRMSNQRKLGAAEAARGCQR